MANKGGQPGNDNAAKGKRWRYAIDQALVNRCKSDGQKALIALAAKLLDEAEKGEAWALKELGDRIDGKPTQSIEASVTHKTHEEMLAELDDK